MRSTCLAGIIARAARTIITTVIAAIAATTNRPLVVYFLLSPDNTTSLFHGSVNFLRSEDLSAA